MPIASCPECGTELHVEEDIDKGEIVECDDCEARLEVVSLDPVELDLAPDPDFDDDFDDYDDSDDDY